VHKARFDWDEMKDGSDAGKAAQQRQETCLLELLSGLNDYDDRGSQLPMELLDKLGESRFGQGSISKKTPPLLRE
jgi:hypothetical protein